MKEFKKYTYHLLLLEHMSEIHNVLYVTFLTKWVFDIERRIFKKKVQVQPNLSYRKEPKEFYHMPLERYEVNIFRWLKYSGSTDLIKRLLERLNLRWYNY